LLSFVQLVIGPYADELGNVLPNAVEGVGVPVDPLAFAGLLGIVVTSLNLLPIGRLEGGRIAQALFGRSTAALLSFGTSLLLAVAVSGDPASAIVALAETRKADLVVVGTREAGLAERVVRHSVSQQVAKKVHCDVLIVHPHH
jgi:nucleotide-binding universal stress UspA family protein